MNKELSDLLLHFAHQSMESFYKNANPIEIQNKIREFRKLNFKVISNSDLFEEINKVLCINGYFSYPINIRSVQNNTLFFRVRKIRGTAIPFENFKTLSDMWEPPKDKITSIGRLNQIGESLLYTSLGDPYVAVYEARIKNGDTYALMKYSSIDTVKINIIGGEYDPEHPPFQDDNSMIVYNLINDFLRDEFSRDVGEGTEYLYKISERIAKDYFDLPPRETQDAWAYSSIQDRNKLNVCFRPEIAHDLLKLQGAIICKKKEDEGIHPLCVAIPANDNTTINYSQLGSDVQKMIFPEILVQ